MHKYLHYIHRYILIEIMNKKCVAKKCVNCLLNLQQKSRHLFMTLFDKLLLFTNISLTLNMFQ